MQTSELEIIGPVAPQSLTVSRYNARGVQLGDRVLMGGKTASELRKELKGKHKGRALTLAVNAALLGEKSRRNIVGQGCVSALLEKGFTFETCDFNKTNTVATVRMLKIETPAASPEKAMEAAQGLSIDLLEALIAAKRAEKSTLEAKSN